METGIGTSASSKVALILRITVEIVFFRVSFLPIIVLSKLLFVLKFDYKSLSVNCKRYWKLLERDILIHVFMNLKIGVGNKQKCCKTYMM